MSACRLWNKTLLTSYLHAEVEGFGPSVPHRYGGFQDHWFKPLTQTSLYVNS